MENKKAVSVSISGLDAFSDREFSYLCPDELNDKVFPGAKVVVPFGRGGKKREGIVTGYFKDDGSIPLKYVLKAENEETFVNEDDIELARFMARRYYAPLYDCLNLMSIPGTGVKFKGYYILGENSSMVENELSKRIIDYIAENEKPTLKQISEAFNERGFKTAFESCF